MSLKGMLSGAFVFLLILLGGGWQREASAESSSALSQTLASEAANLLARETGVLPTVDPRMSVAATSLCGSSLAGVTLDLEAAREVLWDQGVADHDFTFRVVRFRGNPPPGRLLEGLVEGVSGHAYTSYGIAVSGEEGGQGDSLCTALVLSRRIAFPYGDFRPRDSKMTRFGFTLARGYTAPRLVVTGGDGRTQEGEVTLVADGFRGELPSGVRGGLAKGEVVAEGPHGTEVALLFPGHERGEQPVLPDFQTMSLPSSGGDSSSSSPVELEKTFAEWVNGERRAHHLPPLVVDAALSTIARSHCVAMKEGNYFGHASPDGATVVDRLRENAYLYDIATENIGKATSARRAQEAFMASPGHRSNILDPRVTHLGVGVLYWGKEILVTMDFVHPLEEGDGEQLHEKVMAKVNELRSKGELLPLKERRVLSEMAQALAGRAAETGSVSLKEAGAEGLGDRVRFALPYVGKVSVDLVVGPGPFALEGSERLMLGSFAYVGIGVVRAPGSADAQGRRAGEGMWWMVMVLAAPMEGVIPPP